MEKELFNCLIESNCLLQESIKLIEENHLKGMADTVRGWGDAAGVNLDKPLSKAHDAYMKSLPNQGKAHKSPWWWFGSIPGMIAGTKHGVTKGIKSGTDEAVGDLAKYGGLGLGAGVLTAAAIRAAKRKKQENN